MVHAIVFAKRAIAFLPSQLAIQTMTEQNHLEEAKKNALLSIRQGDEIVLALSILCWRLHLHCGGKGHPAIPFLYKRMKELKDSLKLIEVYIKGLQ